MNAPDHQLVARVVAALADRTDAQGAELAARWCPPDRHDPLALEWLRRWAPRPAHFPPPLCSCATGTCLVCN